MKIQAPFSEEQVKALNAYQEAGYFHPFTCGNDSRHRNLVATSAGWVCPDCDYTQDWAHRFMTEQLTEPEALPDDVFGEVLAETNRRFGGMLKRLGEP